MNELKTTIEEIRKLCEQNGYDGFEEELLEHIESLKAERDQAQAKGAELLELTNVFAEAFRAELEERDDREDEYTRFWTRQLAKLAAMSEGNPGQTLLDRLEKLERVRDGAEEHLLGCDSYARELRKALAACPPTPEGLRGACPKEDL